MRISFFLIFFLIFIPFLAPGQMMMEEAGEQAVLIKSNKVKTLEKLNGENISTRYEYDTSGFLLKEFKYINDQLTSWSTYENNSLGQVIHKNSYSFSVTLDTLVTVSHYDYKGTRWIMKMSTEETGGKVLYSVNTGYDTLGYDSYTITFNRVSFYNSNKFANSDTTYTNVDTVDKNTLHIFRYDNKHHLVMKGIFKTDDKNRIIDTKEFTSPSGSDKYSLLTYHSHFVYSENDLLLLKKHDSFEYEPNGKEKTFHRREVHYDEFGNMIEYKESSPLLENHYLFKNNYRSDGLLDFIEITESNHKHVDKVNYKYAFY